MTFYYDNVYIKDKYSLLASLENNPIVKDNCDKVIDDYYIGCNTIEEAESKYQFITISELIKKSKLQDNNISLLISSDLQNQNLASNYNSTNFNIPSLNIYSACASFIEGLIIASTFIMQSNMNIIVTVSSHNLVNEKQFRFPIEYGAVKKMVNSFSSTGSISALIGREKSNIKITSGTIGKIIKTSHKDSNDMGSAMAPACAEVIFDHLKTTGRKNTYYDLILTGDLGEYGLKIMKEYYKKKYNVSLDNVIDSGDIYYKDNTIYAGASGPLCIPLVFFDYILKENKYKKILLVGTGSLHSVVSSNLKLAMPGVAHAISLEVS